jgi:hypothetical protein
MNEDTEIGVLPVAVLGAGASVREWGHVRIFSPWRYNVDGTAGRLLTAAGWSAPDPDGLPSGHELVDEYLAPLTKLPAIGPHLRFGHRATGISRVGMDRVRTRGREAVPFLIRVRTVEGLAHLRARAVIDASGTWRTPNVLGASGASDRRAARGVGDRPGASGRARR